MFQERARIYARRIPRFLAIFTISSTKFLPLAYCLREKFFLFVDQISTKFNPWIKRFAVQASCKQSFRHEIRLPSLSLSDARLSLLSEKLEKISVKRNS